MNETSGKNAMEVFVNGESMTVTSGATLAELVELLNLQPRALAVEVNQEIIPQNQHDRFRLSPRDQLEIVSLVGGG